MGYGMEGNSPCYRKNTRKPSSVQLILIFLQPVSQGGINERLTARTFRPECCQNISVQSNMYGFFGGFEPFRMGFSQQHSFLELLFCQLSAVRKDGQI